MCGWHGTCLLYLVMHCVPSEQWPSLTCINHITPMRCTLPAGVSICTGFSQLGAGSMPMSLGNQILDKLIQRTCYSPDHMYVCMKVPVYLRARRIKSDCVPEQVRPKSQVCLRQRPAWCVQLTVVYVRTYICTYLFSVGQQG